MEKLKEFDSIITLVDKNDIPKGTIGCVVHIYKDFEAYTCELFDENFKTIGVYDFKADEIKKYVDDEKTK